MTDIAKPLVYPGLRYIPESVTAAIVRGEQRLCTHKNGTMCLSRRSVAWCTRCQGPRCETHAKACVCATCGNPAIAFALIRGTVR